MIRNLALFLITASLISNVSSESITSPQFCLSDVECPPTSFCNVTNSSELSRCTPRLPKNAVCNNVGLTQCKRGLTCTFDESISRFDPVCRRRISRGAECRLEATRPCLRSLICERNTTTCQPFTDGFAGTPCEFDRHCQQDKGFYCQTDPGVCAPKLGPGSECGIAGDNLECLGFCAGRGFKGICLSARKEGDFCTENQQCENRFFGFSGPREDFLICNLPKGVVGRCIRESRLLKRLGAKCDPFYDRCDTRRALSCHPTRSGRHVCQHRVSRFTDEFWRFCEPNNRLSRCPWGEAKTECRLTRVVPGQFMPTGPIPFFWCLRQSERVARGGVCITEYAACTRGTECREVPGVQPDISEPFNRFPLQRVAFCVRVVQRGGSCGDVKNKFTTQCGEGLRCKKGTCVKAEEGEAPFDETVTHAGLNADCEELPCSPGLTCEKPEYASTKICRLPLRIVGKGVTCTDRAGERRRCKNGLVCVLRKDGTNVRRCRELRKEGDYCEENEECDKGLECPFTWTGNRAQEERRCYDPRTTLNIGQTCDPKAGASQPRCVSSEIPDEFFPGGTVVGPMRCLKKGDGFACRAVVSLFEFCDEARDVTCDIGQKCGSLGVCVSEGET